jgi:ribonuclease P protein component
LPFSRQTLPNYRRLNSSEEFELALTGFISNNRWFSAYARGNKIGVSRLGVVVSKRIIPHAVTRNFVKRLVREEFRRNFPVKYAVDIVIRLRRPLNHLAADEGQKALAQLLAIIQKDATTSD